MKPARVLAGLLAGGLLLPALLACTGGQSGGSVGTHVDDWRDEVIYQLLVDRFDNGDPSNDELDGVGLDPLDLRRHQGGDWRGLRRRLGYVQELGATAIWISPIVRNVDRTSTEDGYHGYWASDFTTLNPRFGDLDELRRLVAAAHARDLLVIVDMVPNHAGRVFSYDLDGDGVTSPDEVEPPFREAGPIEAPLLWHVPPPRVFDARGGTLELTGEHFHRRGFGDLGDPVELVLGDFHTGLRDLDTEQDVVIEALIATYAHWVLATDVDGFRIDAVPHVARPFWPRFCEGVRARVAAAGKTRFLMIGEVAVPNASTIAPFTEEGGIDSFLDYPLKTAFIDGVLLAGDAPMDAAVAIEGGRAEFATVSTPGGVGLSPWQARVVFADNHDTGRIAGELEDPRVVELAMVALFTLDAIPAVYYGTEQGFDGRIGGEAREPLWTSGFSTDAPLFGHIARLAALRRSSAALRRGDLVLRFASVNGGRSAAEDAGLVAWERTLEGERLLVVINAHALDTSGHCVPTGFAPGSQLEDALGGSIRPVVEPDGSVCVSLAPRTALILRRP